MSLSAIPLYLDSIHKVTDHQIEVTGTAVLFESYNFTVVPNNMDWHLAARAIDIASLGVQIKRMVFDKYQDKVLVIGCGNAGKLAMATVKTYSPKTTIIGIDIDPKNFPSIKRFGFTDKLAQIDATKTQSVIDFVSGCSLVINCVNIPDTEASSVLAARNHGTVVFFSMATQFDKASLATDATGKDVTMIVASGIAQKEDEEVFKLLEIYPDLLN